MANLDNYANPLKKETTNQQPVIHSTSKVAIAMIVSFV